MDRRGFLGGLVNGALALLGLSAVKEEGIPNDLDGLPSSLCLFPLEINQFQWQNSRTEIKVNTGELTRIWVEAVGPPPGLDVHAFRRRLLLPRNAVVNGVLYHVHPTKLEMTPFAVKWEAELREHA